MAKLVNMASRVVAEEGGKGDGDTNGMSTARINWNRDINHTTQGTERWLCLQLHHSVSRR